ncbi:putative zn 2cys6 transcription factor protein [Botrytis fragariae]|uniref:Putative zn 2cys6 transcription factor protein n=1 Tax=Botrytis fragariae TaxID=1964551 RepID=A0A8H6ENP7_9HELO|nr:putative zn 2cys6 transcription factor protein [Botrytis fragariae]KAF5878849.1 putative zn 2cys6 transcription factor protein [Botrytis fragariae]
MLLRVRTVLRERGGLLGDLVVVRAVRASDKELIGRRVLRGNMVVVSWGTPEQIMEDPDTSDPEIEPPQKARTSLLSSGSVFFLCSSFLSAENEAAIARCKLNRARTEKEHRAYKTMVLWQFAVHELSVGGPACSYNNDYTRDRRTKIQPNPNYKLNPQHSVLTVPQDNSHLLLMTFRRQFRNNLIAPPRPLQPQQQQQHSSTTGYAVSGRASIDVNPLSYDYEVELIQGAGLKVSMLQINLQSSEFLVSNFGRMDHDQD